ncbi:Glutamyl aminopeptidase [Aphelenchoides fujianensis]|nr:Glutamyl aminopeptidase [Aphelenchoides fujianensis]
MSLLRSEHHKLSNECAVQPKQRGFMGKCVLCLLVQAIFLFGIFLTFLISHYVSEVEFGNDTFLMTAIHNHVNGDLSTPLPHANWTNQSADAGFPLHDSSTDPIDAIVTLQPPVPPVKLTLRDVYAPEAEDPRPNAWTHKSAAQFARAAAHSLPSNVRPLHYEVEFDFTEFETEEHINGRARILLESFGNSSAKELQLHAASNIFIERLKLEARRYKLQIEFRTRICQSEVEATHCITHMTYGKDGAKTKRKIVGFTTKFEPSFAKTFLPCWDEPRIRATFNISVVHSLQYTALFNTRPLGSAKEVRPGVGITNFRETPQMPVFLLGFVLAELTPLELHTTRNLPLSIWTPLGVRTTGAHFAAHFAPVIFDRVEKDVEVLYPLDKIDLVVTPEYPVDACEHWGLIVFRDSNVLLTSQNMTVDRISEQYRVEKIVSHEIIHQWFGNQVSVADWADVWLSEGFTSYFVFDFLNTDHPHLTDNEYYLELIGLLKRQTSNYRTALVHSADTPQQADDLFDGVSLYTKGAVIVKMIKDLLGVEKFRQGITRFLSENSFKARAADQNNYVVYLADSWNASAVLPAAIHKRDGLEWTAGFSAENFAPPTAGRRESELAAIRDGGRRIASISSEGPNTRKSTRKARGRPNSTDNSRRNTADRTPTGICGRSPVGYLFGSIRSSGGQTVRQFWLHNETIRFVDLGVQSYQYVLANPHWIFPYRVNYDLSNWKLLIDQLHRDHSEIPVMSRLQLIVDGENYLRQSDVPQLYVRLLGYLAKEEDLGVLLVGLDAMHELVDLVSGTPLVGPLLIHLTGPSSSSSTANSTRRPPRTPNWRPSGCFRPCGWPNSTNCGARRICTCDQNKQLALWISQPSALHADDHQQAITAVCHYLFTQAGPAELAALMGLLRQSRNSPNAQWSVNTQLATCARDEELIENVVTAIVRTRNAAVYLSVLQASYSVQYNRKFREVFWRGLGRLSTHERQLLFAINTGKPDRIARLLLHSVKTVEELDLVETLLDQWPDHLQHTAVPQIHKFLIEDVQ